MENEKELEDFLESFDKVCQEVRKVQSSNYMKSYAYRLLSAAKGKNRSLVLEGIVRLAMSTETNEKSKIIDYMKELLNKDEEQFEKIVYLLVGKIIKYG